jgi:pimeloyl-ACP methyl ester carboxylesterase
VLALHPLALESSAFEGIGAALAARGLRTLAVDLPGFGATPAPAEPLAPRVLAAPVVDLARELDGPPVLLGISLGGRVALEAALHAPDAFDAVVAVSPYLPWKRRRWLLGMARHFDPRHAERMPFERIWPLLQAFVEGAERLPFVRSDPMVRAGVRMLYYVSCPATRASLLSAVRELAVEPAFGPDGFWPRLATLRVPAAFVWGRSDRLVSYRFASHVHAAVPHAAHTDLRCCGHAPYGAHGACIAAAVSDALGRLQGEGTAPAAPGARAAESTAFVHAPCRAAA